MVTGPAAFDEAVVLAAREIIDLGLAWGEPPKINCSELIRRIGVSVRVPFETADGPWKAGDAGVSFLWDWAIKQPGFSTTIGGIGIVFFDSPFFPPASGRPNHVGVIVERDRVVASCGMNCREHDGPVEHDVAHGGIVRGWIEFPRE